MGGQAGLHNEFQASWGYTMYSLTPKKEGIKVEKYCSFYESIKYTDVQSLHLVAFSYTVYKNPSHVPQMDAPYNPIYMEFHSMKYSFLSRHNITCLHSQSQFSSYLSKFRHLSKFNSLTNNFNLLWG